MCCVVPVACLLQGMSAHFIPSLLGLLFQVWFQTKRACCLQALACVLDYRDCWCLMGTIQAAVDSMLSLLEPTRLPVGGKVVDLGCMSDACVCSKLLWVLSCMHSCSPAVLVWWCACSLKCKLSSCAGAPAG